MQHSKEDMHYSTLQGIINKTHAYEFAWKSFV